jgi:CRP/FNR family transcriptional regulator
MTDDTSREHRDVFYAFLAQYPTRSFARREAILQQAEVPPAAFIVKSGIVKSYDITAQGEEKPITFILKDEVFPLGWVLTQFVSAPYYYEALTDCEVYMVPIDDYVRFLKTTPGCLFELHRGLAERNVEYHMRINALEQSRASDKVLHTLYFLAHRFGKDVKENIIRIELPLTQQGIANFMGLARETAAIELKKLERQGVIKYSHHTYTIHMPTLLDLVGSESSDTLTTAEPIPAFD